MSSEIDEKFNESGSIPDNDKWWDDFVKERFPEDKCIKYFKCSRKTYFYLIKFLKPYVAPRGLHAYNQEDNLYLRKGKL